MALFFCHCRIQPFIPLNTPLLCSSLSVTIFPSMLSRKRDDGPNELMKA